VAISRDGFEADVRADAPLGRAPMESFGFGVLLSLIVLRADGEKNGVTPSVMSPSVPVAKEIG